MKFTNYLSQLDEKLITFNGRAYPKFGQVVIMAGGAGGGKGTVLSKLVGIEGITFDVDELKTLASKSALISKKVKDELGVDLPKLSADLRNPKNVSKLHAIIGDHLNLPKKHQAKTFRSVLAAHPDRKPNIIFDVTLKDLMKLENISKSVKAIGYDTKNIHIVWVVNDINIAIEQNRNRSRVVPKDILVNTHRGVSQTMGDILNMGKNLGHYMDGDIVFAFNAIGVDSELAKSDKGGSYFKRANYIYIKKTGKPPYTTKELSSEMKNKIRSYVPKGITWD